MNTPGAFTVSIEDIAAPATFTHLQDALNALWEALRVLPLGWNQFEAYRFFLGDGAVERVTEFLDRDGELTLSFAIGGRSHLIEVTRA
ncbi:hypothetical protein ACIRPK_25525 [Kitasatospora sp. NPDC101801]|uniref:hypothetical protein n=1 Tax=unclassified Kitasatospora TaxID=2633591 RepID=UPI003247278B